MPKMPLSVLCEICKAVNDDKISQMFAAGLNIEMSDDAVFLIAMAAREIQDESVRDWALNELRGPEVQDDYDNNEQ